MNHQTDPEPITAAAESADLLLAAGPGRTIAVTLRIAASPPLGELRIGLNSKQIASLTAQLWAFAHLPPDRVAELVTEIHGPSAS